jgi:hypothetical protein
MRQSRPLNQNQTMIQISKAKIFFSVFGILFLFLFLFHASSPASSSAATDVKISSRCEAMGEPLALYLLALKYPGLPVSVQIQNKVQSWVEAAAPKLWWHSGEVYHGMDPNEYISKSELLIKGQLQKSMPTPEQISKLSDDANLKFHFNSFLPEKSAPMLWKLGEGTAASRLCRDSKNHSRILLEYWYFSSFNFASRIGIGNHEGDWEGISVLLDVGNDLHFKPKIIAVYFSAHAAGIWKCAKDLTFSDGHVETFSAVGTHADYPEPGDHSMFFITDHTDRGKKWDTWLQLRPLVLEKYYGFLGNWGKKSLFNFMSGPQSPGPNFKPKPHDWVPLESALSCD